MGRLHFAGIAGTGMSALAQYEVLRGRPVSGSDRAFDGGGRSDARALFERLGIEIHPQDGSGVAGSEGLIVSTAVEDTVPDVRAARALGVPVVHRSELLASRVAESRSVAVTGTCGKSTVVAMVFDILRGVGMDPSAITGGEIRSITGEGLLGNAWAGRGDILVIEADESDGSLVRYEPAIGVILNLARDHREPEETLAWFRTFASRTRERLVVGDAENLRELAEGAITFGTGEGALVRAHDVVLAPGSVRFASEGATVTVPSPGEHTVENALAAIATCRALGVPVADAVAPLARFCGVARRFESLGSARGVEVVDDYAHNPRKIRAAIDSARRRGRRVVAVYQPHGFGPTRFLLGDLVDAFAAALGETDLLYVLDVFYAGGTARRDVSGEDIASGVRARGRHAEAATRADVASRIASEAKPGDVVLVMGARDPTLTDLCREVLGLLRAGGDG